MWISFRRHNEANSAKSGQTANWNQLLVLECTTVTRMEKCYAKIDRNKLETGTKIN
jgi:hypothetical protein